MTTYLISYDIASRDEHKRQTIEDCLAKYEAHNVLDLTTMWSVICDDVEIEDIFNTLRRCLVHVDSAFFILPVCLGYVEKGYHVFVRGRKDVTEVELNLIMMGS